MDWTNGYDPTTKKDYEGYSPFEMILGRDREYTPEEVNNMTLCELFEKGLLSSLKSNNLKK